VVLWRVVVRRERVTGHLVTAPFRDANGSSAEAVARRAIAQVVGSTSPNSLVVGFSDDEELVLLHELVDTGKPPAVDPWEPGW
jgi:hypothetical protein